MPSASEKTARPAAAATCRNTRRANSRPGSSLSARCSYMAEAGLRVVVGHADRLHVGVHDRRADELEAALQQVLAQRVRLRRLRGDLASLEDDRLAADEAPDVGVEAAEFLLHGEKGQRVGFRRPDLEAIPDDAGIAHQRLQFPGGEAGNLLR